MNTYFVSGSTVSLIYSYQSCRSHYPELTMLKCQREREAYGGIYGGLLDFKGHTKSSEQPKGTHMSISLGGEESLGTRLLEHTACAQATFCER